MAEPVQLTLADEEATYEQGARLGAAVRDVQPKSLVVFLEGELGAGKTTLARGCLAAFGHRGRVPSPTYTLVEPYELADYRFIHVDLYRIGNAAEVEGLGLADQLGPGTIALIEWPEHGGGYLPAPDLRVRLRMAGAARVLQCAAESAAGRAILERWPGRPELAGRPAS